MPSVLKKRWVHCNTGKRVFSRCRVKAGGNQSESQLISQLQHGLALEFERSDPARKLRLLLSELLFVMTQVRRSFFSDSKIVQLPSSFFWKLLLIFADEGAESLLLLQIVGVV